MHYHLIFIGSLILLKLRVPQKYCNLEIDDNMTINYNVLQKEKNISLKFCCGNAVPEEKLVLPKYDVY